MATGVRRSRRALTAVVTLMLVGCGSEVATESVSPAAETASDVPSQIPSAAPPSPSESPLPTLLGWQPVLVPVSGTVYSVAEGPNGWVAVGRASGSVGAPVWFSEDGVNWVAASTTPPANFEPILTDVVAGGPGYLAAGTDFLIDGGPPFIWTSPDGLHWTAASFGDGVTLGHVHGLKESAGRLFAGGSLVGDGGFGTGPAVMWSSADATDWTQTILESGGARGTYATTPVSLADELVSVGGAYQPYKGLVWTTAGGARWSLVPSTTLEGGLLEDAAYIGTRLVAVGGIYEDRDDPLPVPAIWASDDGRSWETAYMGACCSRVEHVAAFGDGALAIASDVVYLSDDGVTWHLGGAIGGFSGQLVDLVVIPSFGVVLVGNDGEENYLLVPPKP